MLCSRLGGLQLRRTRISSEGSVAGVGLFATRDIKKGDLITCYPCDALIYSIPGSDDSGVIFGSHVPEDVVDVDKCFGAWVDYGLFEDDDYAVIGIPELPHDAAYAGHMANDGAMLRCNGTDEEEEEDEEEALAVYEAESAKRRNAMHEDLAGLHMVTVATRRITCGEEVLVSYGADYWRAFAQRQRDRARDLEE